MADKKKENKTYSQDQVVTILEDIKDQFTAFGEGLDVVSHTVERLEGRFDTLEGRFDTLEGRFNTLEGRFDHLESRFDTLEAKVDRMQDDITDIKHELSQKVNLEDFQKLEKRVVRMEKIVLVAQKKRVA